MTTKERELFEECKMQLIHIHDVVGRKQFGSTKNVIKKIEQALTAPVDTEEKELPEFLMKDSEGKIITCFIGGADVTEHWNNYLSETKTT
jgi:hypothetical protein